jgi:hypothetical protein
VSCSSAQRSSSCSSSTVSGRANQRAGPPVPIVVWRASATFSSTTRKLATQENDGAVDVARSDYEQHVAGTRPAGQARSSVVDPRRVPR